LTKQLHLPSAKIVKPLPKLNKAGRLCDEARIEPFENRDKFEAYHDLGKTVFTLFVNSVLPSQALQRAYYEARWTHGDSGVASDQLSFLICTPNFMRTIYFKKYDTDLISAPR